ncbi:MAG: hypothetical protein EAZ85_11325 [Bacteroidetes bacterium]|nr:MAG: hypothetical protein EAZ85_11325 [Bacteroidota bacterium]TAG91699.1 MAG: hypothetical protein EAZ20_03105 [Bacteroidota bacterium]
MKLQRYFIFFIGLFLLNNNLFAQCAMCRASLENSMSNGENLVRGINYGIIYLASAPYLAIVIVIYFWYKNSKKNYAQRIKTASHPSGKMPSL